MSAAPLFDEAALLPCLATVTLQAAQTKATAVEILSVPAPSPPVPQTSIEPCGAWLVHGSDGLDEITTTGPTHVVELRDGNLREFEISPEQFDLPRASAAELKGGDPGYNAEALRTLFDGAVGPYRDIVRMNAAAALVVAGKAQDMAQGMALAAEALDFGHAREKLDALIRVTNAVVEGITAS